MCRFYIILLFNSVVVNVTFGKNTCSPADDKYFDLSKNKCRRCPRCPLGTGREYFKINHGEYTTSNTACLPCIACSFGTYNDRRGLTNECRQCTNNKCSNLNRRVEKNCTSTRDFVCGHCITGYEDIYTNTMLACVKSKPKPGTVGHNLTPTSLIKIRSTPLSKTEQKTHNTIQSTLPPILGALVLIFVFIVGVTVYLKFCRKKECKDTVRAIEQGTCTHGQSSSTILSTSTEETDPLVEQDGPKEQVVKNITDPLVEQDGPIDQVVTKITDTLVEQNGPIEQVVTNITDPLVEQDGPIEQVVTNKHVRGEIQSVGSVPSSARDGQPVYLENCTGDGYFNFEKKICTCTQRSCGDCCKITQADDTIIKRGDQILEEIACSICHDPIPFFHKLGIPDSDVYGLDNDRERRPGDISQREFIHSVLKRWTELETTNATVGKIRQALCYGGFHRINENILPKQQQSFKCEI